MLALSSFTSTDGQLSSMPSLSALYAVSLSALYAASSLDQVLISSHYTGQITCHMQRDITGRVKLSPGFLKVFQCKQHETHKMCADLLEHEC